MNELYLFPAIGRKPISSIKAKALLDALRKVEAKGILSTAQAIQFGIFNAGKQSVHTNCAVLRQLQF
jgi:glycosyltransferase A (GT-A) superfamily protein (DUF2064 family)